MMSGLIKVLVGGSNKINPKISVRNPGVSNNIPPTRMQIPSSISSPGNLPN